MTSEIFLMEERLSISLRLVCV